MIRSLRIVFPFLSALALLAMPSVAGASNLIPNPGFEATCPGPVGSPGVPCDWRQSLIGESFVSTAVAPRSGTKAGVLSLAGGQLSSASISSSCITAITGGSSYAVSVWFRTLAAVKSVAVIPAFDSSGNCHASVFAGQGAVTSSLFADGSWQFISGQDVAPAWAKSVRVAIGFTCVGTCPVGANVTFDDVSFGPAGTTAATIRSFTATRSRAGTLVRWRTASEVEVAGFNVYRLEHGRAVKVNRHLVAAKARAGASYRLLDRGHRGARYRLEVVNLDGTRQTRVAR